MILQDGLVTVRWYDEADLSALVRVHAACFPSEKWKAKDFRRFADKPGQIVRTIVTEDELVVGSLLYRNTRDEVRIARVAVLPEHQKQGLATFAIRMLTGPNSPNRKRVVTARVREHNVTAQLLLRNIGFSFDGTLDSFYKKASVEVGGDVITTDEDAYLFSFTKEVQPRRRRLERRESRPPVLYP